MSTHRRPIVLIPVLALLGCASQQKQACPAPPPCKCDTPAAASQPTAKKDVDNPFEELAGVLTEVQAIIGKKGERCAKSAGEMQTFMNKRQRRLSEILDWYTEMSTKKLTLEQKKEMGKRYEASAGRFLLIHREIVPVVVQCAQDNKDLREAIDPLTTALLRFIKQTPMSTAERRFYQLCELVAGDGMCPRDGKPLDPFQLWVRRLRDPRWAAQAVKELSKLGDIRAVQPLCDLYKDFPAKSILKALRSFKKKTKVPCIK